MPADRVPPITSSVWVSSASRARQVALLAADVVSIAASLYLSYLVRFEGDIPPTRLAEMFDFLPLLIGVRLASAVVFGIHRWSFRLSGFHEAVRLVQAQLTGTASFVALFYFLQRSVADVTLGPPR